MGYLPRQHNAEGALHARDFHAAPYAAVRAAQADNRTEGRVDKRNEHPQAVVGRSGQTERRHPALGGGPRVSFERRAGAAELERSHRRLQKIVAQFDTLREEEQRRLAHDMHDDLGQLLAAMRIELGLLRARLPAGCTEAQGPLASLNELVDTMMVSVRRIIADLPPKILEDVGLVAALDLLLASFQKRHKIAARFDRPTHEPQLDPALCTPLYRMVQEALNNVAKHAHATQVELLLQCEAGQLIVRVRDNGTGLAPGCLHKPDSFGLIGMRQRVSALGGSFAVSNIRDAGTDIHIVIPLRAAP
jgi:signal transduction histidine kinase